MSDKFKDLDFIKLYESIKVYLKADRVGAIIGLVLTPIIFFILVLIMYFNTPFIITIILIILGLIVEVFLLIMYLIIKFKSLTVFSGTIIEKKIIISQRGGKTCYIKMDISDACFFDENGFSKEYESIAGKIKKITTPESIINEIPENKEILIVCSASGVTIGYIKNGNFKNNILNVPVNK